jgi:hypothetical protein
VYTFLFPQFNSHLVMPSWIKYYNDLQLQVVAYPKNLQEIFLYAESLKGWRRELPSHRQCLMWRSSTGARGAQKRLSLLLCSVCPHTVLEGVRLLFPMECSRQQHIAWRFCRI